MSLQQHLCFEYLASMELTELGWPIIDERVESIGLSAHLVVRDGRDVVFVAKAVGRAFMFNSIQIDARMPAHATVRGRVLLADRTVDSLRTLYQDAVRDSFTVQTPTALEALEQAVADDARNGAGSACRHASTRRTGGAGARGCVAPVAVHQPFACRARHFAGRGGPVLVEGDMKAGVAFVAKYADPILKKD